MTDKIRNQTNEHTIVNYLTMNNALLQKLTTLLFFTKDSVIKIIHLPIMCGQFTIIIAMSFK